MEVDRSWELTRWGRIDQGRRELAVVLGKDVSVEKLADLIGLAGPSLWGWKQGSRPKEASIEALERIFVGAGLTRYTRRYIDYGPESAIAETSYRDGLQRAAGASQREARVAEELEADRVLNRPRPARSELPKEVGMERPHGGPSGKKRRKGASG